MKTGPYPDLFGPEFFAMPMALSSAWMDFWLMPMRISMGLIGNVDMADSPASHGHAAKAVRSQSESDKLFERAEDELAGIDKAHHDTEVNLAALVS